MKKVVYYIIIFLVLLFGNSFCYAKEDIQLKDSIISFSKPKNYSLQGFTTVNDKLFLVLEGYDDTKSIIKVFNLNTYEEIISYEYSSLGHANDVTYNKINNTIYVISGSGSNTIYMFNDKDFQYISAFNIDLPVRSITYIDDKDMYAVRTVSTGYMYDNSFKLTSNYPFIIGMNFGFDMGRQGWTYYNGYIYYTIWSWIRYGGDGGNVIHIYNLDGHRIDSLNTAKDIGEIEGVAFYNNKMYLGFNGYDGNVKFYMIDAPIIKEEIQEVVNIKEPYKIKNSKTIWIFLTIFSTITVIFCMIIKLKENK